MIKIISGGQTGVDLAGLDAAKKNGLETGGWMPRRWQNLEGQQPHFATLYGMNEHRSVGYAPRTKQNIVDSDGTLIIATNQSSPGTRLTISAAKLFKKKIFICNIAEDCNIGCQKCRRPMELQSGELQCISCIGNLGDVIYNWIIDNKFEIVNIAGNSEQTSPGIYDQAFKILDEVFYKIKNI